MAVPTPDRAAPANERLHPVMIQGAALIVILALAAVLRFGELGARAFQADEAIASLVSAQFANGGGYEHLPLDHGPFQYLVTSAAFRLFGIGDFTARLMPALFGVALAAVPFTMTRQLGRVGAIAAALMLAVSPTALYYSRFAGPDIFMAVFAALTAGAIWRYLEGGQRSSLYAMAAALACMIITTEMALAIVPLFAAYLWYRAGSDFAAQMTAEAPEAAHPSDHYAVLCVPRDAAAKDIRIAYRKLIETAEERPAREALAHAYGVLTNDNRRAAYDRRLARAAVAAADAPAEDAAPGIAARALVFAASGAIAALWPAVGGIRANLRLRTLPRAADALLVLTLLSAMFYGPLVEQIGVIGDRGFEGQMQVYVVGGSGLQTPGGELPVMLVTLGIIFSATMLAGMVWRWHAWIICSAIFYGITITAFTGFFTNGGGIWTGFWGTFDYWSRPEADIHEGPAYYYAMLLPVYEFLPLGVAALGAAFLAVRGAWRDRLALAAGSAAIAALCALPETAPVLGARREELALAVAAVTVLALRLPELTKFLALWAVGAFFMFTMIDEKQPWLALHIAVPAALLAARLVNDAIVGVPVPELPRPSLRVVAGPRLAQASLAAMVAAVAVFAMQTGMLASWGHGSVPQLATALALTDNGDTPIELLQPASTAGDVRQVRDAIAAAGIASGRGHDQPVVVDTSRGFAQAWVWYLRDYTNLQLEDLRKPFDAPAGAIVLADARNRPNVRNVQADASLTYTQRYELPATRYAGRSAGEIASGMVSASQWGAWLDYVRDRESIGALQSYDGVAWFPVELSVALPVRRHADVLAAEVAPGDSR